MGPAPTDAQFTRTLNAVSVHRGVWLRGGDRRLAARIGDGKATGAGEQPDQLIAAVLPRVNRLCLRRSRVTGAE